MQKTNFILFVSTEMPGVAWIENDWLETETTANGIGRKCTCSLLQFIHYTFLQLPCCCIAGHLCGLLRQGSPVGVFTVVVVNTIPLLTVSGFPERVQLRWSQSACVTPTVSQSSRDPARSVTGLFEAGAEGSSPTVVSPRVLSSWCCLYLPIVMNHQSRLLLWKAQICL